MKDRYLVRTLGCKANLYDSQLLEMELQKRGWMPSESEVEATLCIVNSCTVTDEADRQTRKLASKMARLNPAASVVVTGCGAEVDPERLAASKGVSYVIGNRDKPRLVELILEKLEKNAQARAQNAGLENDALPAGEILGGVQSYREMLSRHPMDREWPDVSVSFATPPVQLPGSSRKTRAFLKIQEGCNSFCTYCIIPYGRGPSRSLRPLEIVTQIRELIEQGIREVVITGTNVGDYGTDWGAPALADLFKLILAETHLERLRVSSLDPNEITDEIFALMQENPRFCPHFHVSLQSPHSKILRVMKRRYGYEQVEKCLNRIAQLPAPVGGPFVGMDVIAGFPGETSEEFEFTYQALARLPWSRLHVFPYSERAGTPAIRLPDSVPKEERARRAKRLAQLSLERMTAHYDQALRGYHAAGSQAFGSFLLERAPAGPPGGKSKAGTHWVAGYSPNYLRAYIEIGSETPGSYVNRVVDLHPESIVIDAPAGEVAFIARF